MTALIEAEGVKDLVTVSTAAGSVVATAGHPFWSVSDAAWIDAGDLEVGDAVLEADGTETVVTATTELTVQATVHNLTVADIHTYFVVVGDAATLVHNCGTSNVANGVRLRAQLTGEEISGGHAFQKHVIDEGQFPGITTRPQFAAHIENVALKGEMRTLSNGRTAYWNEGTVVIRNPHAIDGGTAFRPADGYDYFLNNLN